jgi:hypothetical protein
MVPTSGPKVPNRATLADSTLGSNGARDRGLRALPGRPAAAVPTDMSGATDAPRFPEEPA